MADESRQIKPLNILMLAILFQEGIQFVW